MPAALTEHTKSPGFFNILAIIILIHYLRLTTFRTKVQNKTIWSKS